MTVTNAEAHEIHEQLKSLCDMFNSDPETNNNFDGLPDHMLAIYQRSAITCWKLFSWLRDQENNEASRAYCVFCGKILIRLSCLRATGERETPEQFAKWIGLYTGGPRETVPVLRL